MFVLSPPTTARIALDRSQRDWTEGFDSREDAVHFNDPGQYVSLANGVDEMMLPFDVLTGVVGIGRNGGKKIVREGGEALAETLFKKTTVQVLREEAERDLIKAGKKVTIQAVNRLVGLAAEAVVEKQLIQEGYEILGSQVTARLANGEIRYLDRLVRSPGGDIIHVEVKSGGSHYSTSQIRKDGEMLATGVVLGNNAPEILRGSSRKIRTMLRRVE